MSLCLIVAMAKNRVIGINNTLPWHLSADLKQFKALTSNHTIIMGRKTFQSIGKALPKRQNIILTRDTDFTAPGCLVTHDVDSALNAAELPGDVFVIGGAEIYRLFLPRAQILYVTEVDTELEGDTYFPAFDTTLWQEINRTPHPADAGNDHPFDFVVYKDRHA